ncbi:MAG: LuxR C-terminal-related transcriptional regulator [Flavobacteriales bacterium]|nr:LuxR C-terminal-related transcriptional regulator [Flavobacteriales bacterium]
MTNQDFNFKSEISEISSKLRVKKEISQERKRFNYKKYPLIHNQAMYILSLSKKEVTYSKNIEQLLGFRDCDFTYDHVFSLIHPEDYPIVEHIVKGVLTYSTARGIPKDGILYLTYRMRKLDGSYIKIQRTSGVCRMNRNRALVGNYSILQDISYMGDSSSSAVRWRWDSPYTSHDALSEYLEFKPANFFSTRQDEIYTLLKQGLSDAEIAEEMNVMPSTIKTQKKRMKTKLNCSSTKEMLQYFESNFPKRE